MKKVGLCVFTVALFALASITSQAQSVQSDQKKAKSLQGASAGKGKSSVEESIMEMERRAWEAVKARDTKTFSDLFAADGVMVDSAGFSTRPAFFQTLPDLTISEYTLTDSKVTMIGKDAALITYKATVKGSYKGQAFPPNPTYTSSIWAKRNGKWVAVYHQETMAQ